MLLVTVHRLQYFPLVRVLCLSRFVHVYDNPSILGNILCALAYFYRLVCAEHGDYFSLGIGFGESTNTPVFVPDIEVARNIHGQSPGVMARSSG